MDETSSTGSDLAAGCWAWARERQKQIEPRANARKPVRSFAMGRPFLVRFSSRCRKANELCHEIEIAETHEYNASHSLTRKTDHPLRRWIEPSPVWMVIRFPPPFNFPRTSFSRILP